MGIPDRARVVVVGGGVIGTSIAYHLGKLGWTKADLQLFSDERALAKAPPDKVCQLVHDWFAAQLAISDADVQQRLLVDSLRPVVAG